MKPTGCIAATAQQQIAKMTAANFGNDAPTTD